MTANWSVNLAGHTFTVINDLFNYGREASIYLFVWFGCDLFFALACRPHGLIIKNFLGAVRLMATGSSARAMTFSARGHVERGRLDLGVKISPSEMHGKIFRRPYLGNGAS
jgi:hypothetical protein